MRWWRLPSNGAARGTLLQFQIGAALEIARPHRSPSSLCGTAGLAPLSPALGDPPANGARRDTKSLGDLPDSVKVRKGSRRAASLARRRGGQSIFREGAGGSSSS